MRIVLVGAQADRDRLRPQLVNAGFDIVAEATARPSPADGVPASDAIVEATSNGYSPAVRSRAVQDDVVPEALTTRELEVLAHVAQGMSNKAIAHALGISDQTVKFHVAAIIGKLGASNRTDAVRRAIRRGLVAI